MVLESPRLAGMSRGVKPLMSDANPTAATANHSFLSEMPSRGRGLLAGPGWEGKRATSREREANILLSPTAIQSGGKWPTPLSQASL